MTLPTTLRARLDAQSGEESSVLTIEEFFDGNTDVGSIGCNLTPAPALTEFRARLMAIRQRSDVQDVFVAVTEDMGDEWPFSDHVFVLTSAPLAEVAAWFEPLQADDPYEVDVWSGPTAFLPALAVGMRAVVAWWD